MTSPSVVRAAIPEDWDEIWRLFLLLHAENAMFPYSKARVDHFLARFIDPSKISPDDNGVRGFIGVIGKAGKLEGIIMMALWQPWYTDQWVLEEWLNHVDPEHRNSNHAKAMIRYAKNIIDNLRPENPDLKLIIGILSTKRTAAKVRLYSQLLTPAGAYFFYPPNEETTAEPLKRLYKAH